MLKLTLGYDAFTFVNVVFSPNGELVFESASLKATTSTTANDQPGPLKNGTYRTIGGQQYTRWAPRPNGWGQTTRDLTISFPPMIIKVDQVRAKEKAASGCSG